MIKLTNNSFWIQQRLVNVYAPQNLMSELKDYIEKKKIKLKKLGEDFNPIYSKNNKPIYLVLSKDSGFPDHPDTMSINGEIL